MPGGPEMGEPAVTSGGSYDDNLQLAKVLFDFDAAQRGEISLVEDEIITVLQVDDSGWWRGEKESGEEGLFPYNYVELIASGKEDASEDAPGQADLLHARIHSDTLKPRALVMSFQPVAIRRIEISSTNTSGEGGKKYTVYHICVESEQGDIRYSSKRYSEFRDLQSALKRSFPIIGKKLQHKMQSKMKDRLEYFSRFKEDVVKKRRNILQEYLQELANNQSISALLMAWLFQGEKAEVQTMRKSTAKIMSIIIPSPNRKSMLAYSRFFFNLFFPPACFVI